ncbi:MAG: hypothetical protein AABY22_25395 [Nanoarchaeota archaeon]
MKTNKFTFKQEGYKYIRSLGNGQHLLADDTGKKEIWFNNKNHASYGLIFKNTHLEFASSFGAENL